MAAVVVQALLTADSPEGLELIAVVGLAVYSAAAYGPRPRALAGLGVTLAGYGIYAAENHDIRTGRASELWAGSFFLAALLAVWLLGVFVHSRREDRQLQESRAARQRAERQAAEAERARLARELHDVISHTLSVVVVQAAGARAAGRTEPATLEKIEASGPRLPGPDAPSARRAPPRGGGP